YVPAFFALARIYEDPETYGLDHLEQDPELELEAIEIDVSTSLAELAKLVDIPYEELRRLNPAWKRGFIPPIGIGPVLLHLPAGHGPRVQQILADNPPPPVSWRVHTVARGETLSEIARVYGVSQKELMAVNNLRNPKVLSVGQIITLPLAKGITAAPQWDPPDIDDQPPRRVRSKPAPNTVAKITESPGPRAVKKGHKVQSGDTLWSISQRYGVELADLKRWNGLRGSFLKLDRELVVFVAR
ncbi:MAG TPA: LysM peptidoglycan-binding domain-containing protein, partial [bacterium]